MSLPTWTRHPSLTRCRGISFWSFFYAEQVKSKASFTHFSFSHQFHRKLQVTNFKKKEFRANLKPVWGCWLKNPLEWPLFFKYFRPFKEKRRPGTFAIFAPRLYNRYNHAHVPGPPMWASAGPGPGSKCSKTVEVVCSYSELKPRPCQREIATDEIQEKKNYRERSNIKSARVSALTGSVPRKMAAARAEGSAPCRTRTCVSGLSTTSLNHSAIGSYRSLEKNCIWIVILLELFHTAFLGAELLITDSSGWISRLGKQYQNSWTQTYDWYILSYST